MLRVDKKGYNGLESIDYSEVVDLNEVNKVYGMPKTIIENVDGRLVSRVVFEATPVEQINEGLKVNDFALENLLANGANLTRQNYDTTTFEQIDKASEAAEILTKKVSAAKNKPIESAESTEVQS